MKKRLTQSEEFEILKLVLDKFLWLGFGVMAYGLFVLINGQPLMTGLFILFGGALLLILFMFLLIREYEVVK